MAHGGSQARGLIGVVAASLRQSHINAGSELCLQLTPQLTATLDPQPLSKAKDGTCKLMVPSQSDSLATEPRQELPSYFVLEWTIMLNLSCIYS